MKAFTLLAALFSLNALAQDGGVYEYYVFGTSVDDPGEAVSLRTQDEVLRKNDGSIEVASRVIGASEDFGQHAVRFAGLVNYKLVIEPSAKVLGESAYQADGRIYMRFSNGKHRNAKVSCIVSQFEKAQLSCFFENGFDHVFIGGLDLNLL